LRIDVERCRLNGGCNQRWDALEPVHDNPRIRYCSLCQSAVHLAADEFEVADLVRMGKSVAMMREDVANRAQTTRHE
jgi:hypothetical protein